MADIAALTRIIAPEVEKLGFALVRVKMLSGEDGPVLQVMAEDPATRQLTLAECGTISRAISDPLDAADPIAEAWRLEVSSPGIDRPLTRLTDYDNWAGHEIRARLTEPANGTKQVKGILKRREGETITVETPKDGEVAFRFDTIYSARLVLTDRLIAETAPIDIGDAELETEEEEL